MGFHLKPNRWDRQKSEGREWIRGFFTVRPAAQPMSA